MNDPPRFEKLRADHAVNGFACGSPDLDRFLARFAWAHQQAGAAQTYVATSADEVLGYYSLAVGEVAHAGTPERLSKGLGRHQVPIMLLALLAVSASRQGHGLGAGLLRDALRRTLQAADIAGIRAMVAHAKDGAARDFYQHSGFAPSPTDPLHLFLLIKDVRRAMGP